MSSLRDEIQMSGPEIDDFLQGRHTLRMATVGSSGSIHLVAMWYGFLGTNLAVETIVKSQKVRNLRRNPQVSWLIDDGDSYGQLRGVEISGLGVIHEDPVVVTEVSRSVIARYQQVTDPERLDAMASAAARNRVAIEFVTERLISWDHRKLRI